MSRERFMIAYEILHVNTYYSAFSQFENWVILFTFTFKDEETLLCLVTLSLYGKWVVSSLSYQSDRRQHSTSTWIEIKVLCARSPWILLS